MQKKANKPKKKEKAKQSLFFIFFFAQKTLFIKLTEIFLKVSLSIETEELIFFRINSILNSRIILTVLLFAQVYVSIGILLKLENNCMTASNN